MRQRDLGGFLTLPLHTDFWLAAHTLGWSWQCQKSVLGRHCLCCESEGEKTQCTTESPAAPSDSLGWVISLWSYTLEVPTITLTILKQRWLWKVWQQRMASFYSLDRTETQGEGRKNRSVRKNVTGVVTWAQRSVPSQGFGDPPKIPALWLLLLLQSPAKTAFCHQWPCAARWEETKLVCGDRVAKLKVGVWCRLDIAPGWLLPWDRNGLGCRARGNIPAKHKEHKSVSCTLAWDWAGAMVSFCLLVGVQWQGAVLTQSRARKSYL